MFRTFLIGNWHGCGGTKLIRIAEDGLAAIRRREELGLPASTPASTLGLVEFAVEPVDGLPDRRAAESWPEGLDSSADLPLVINREKDGELAAMLAAGLVVPNGPAPDGALKLRLACSAWELVCWRRAWHAEQRAERAERKVDALKGRIAKLEAQTVESE